MRLLSEIIPCFFFNHFCSYCLLIFDKELILTQGMVRTSTCKSSLPFSFSNQRGLYQMHHYNYQLSMKLRSLGNVIISGRAQDLEKEVFLQKKCITSLENEAAAKNQEIKNLVELLDKEIQYTGSLSQKLQLKQSQCAQLSQKCTEQQNDFKLISTQLQTEIERLKMENSELSIRREKQAVEIIRLEGTVAHSEELRCRIQQLAKSMRETQMQNKNLKEKLRQLEDKNMILISENNNFLHKLKLLEGEKQGVAHQNQKYAHQITYLISRNHSLQSTLDRITHEKQTILKQVQLLDEMIVLFAEQEKKKEEMSTTVYSKLLGKVNENIEEICLITSDSNEKKQDYASPKYQAYKDKINKQKESLTIGSETDYLRNSLTI